MKEVNVSGPYACLAGGLEFVDLPGLNDPNEARVEVTREYLRGTLAMANAGPNTNGSQFFITLAPQPHLDGRYTVLGRVVNGEEVLDRIVQGDLIERLVVIR